jgi:GPH family glycoside/pentoside/hexuronide:cation symporter
VTHSPPVERYPGTATALSTRIRWSYGAGSLFTSIYGTLPQVVLLYYMTSQLGIPAAVGGAVLFLPKLVEIFIDPAIGLISDRLRTRWGRRRPLMALGTLGFLLVFPLLFQPPHLASPMQYAAFTAAVFTVATFFYSLFFVPYLALPAEMTAHPTERTTLMGLRIGFLSLGVMIAGAGAPLLVNAGGGGMRGYALMNWAYAALCVAAMTLAWVGTIGAPESERRLVPGHLLLQLRSALGNRPFVYLAGAYSLQAAAMGCFAAALPYFVVHILAAAPSTGGLIFLAVTGTSLLVMLPWILLGNRVGKYRCYSFAAVIYGAFSLVQVASGATTPLWQVLLVFVFVGVGFAGVQLFSHALLPDTTVLDRTLTGANREALFSGIWISAEKLGFAGGALLAGALLQLGGLVPAAGGPVQAQPDSAVLAIRALIAVVPATLLALSLPLIWRSEFSATRAGLSVAASAKI